MHTRMRAHMRVREGVARAAVCQRSCKMRQSVRVRRVVYAAVYRHVCVCRYCYERGERMHFMDVQLNP